MANAVRRRKTDVHITLFIFCLFVVALFASALRRKHLRPDAVRKLDHRDGEQRDQAPVTYIVPEEPEQFEQRYHSYRNMKNFRIRRGG
jgi:hypothetical protein